MPNQTQAVAVNARLTPDTMSRLEAASRRQQRPAADIITDAVEGYLNALADFESEVEKGLADLRQGRSISHDDLKDKYRQMGVDVD